MSRVLIVGASGFIGRNLERFFSLEHEVIGTFRRSPNATNIDLPGSRVPLDICDSAAVHCAITSLSPDVVINAGGNKDVRYCESHPDEARRVNALGALHLAQACRAVGARFVLISTDLVFEGAHGGYAEADIPRPALTYGATKLEGERLVLGELPDAVVCRSGGVYGRGSPNLQWLSTELQAGRVVDCFTDVVNTPTYAWNLAEMIDSVLAQGLSGVFHTVGPQRVNRFEWFSRFATEWGYDSSLLRPLEAGEGRRKALLLLTNASLASDATRQKLRLVPDDLAQGFRRLRAEGDL
jgi:dTDP-4-dehydrorhamnose reductase